MTNQEAEKEVHEPKSNYSSMFCPNASVVHNVYFDNFLILQCAASIGTTLWNQKDLFIELNYMLGYIMSKRLYLIKLWALDERVSCTSLWEECLFWSSSYCRGTKQYSALLHKSEYDLWRSLQIALIDFSDVGGEPDSTLSSSPEI